MQTLHNWAGANQSGEDGLKRQQGAAAAAATAWGNRISSDQTQLLQPLHSTLYEMATNKQKAQKIIYLHVWGDDDIIQNVSPKNGHTNRQTQSATTELGHAKMDKKWSKIW